MQLDNLLKGLAAIRTFRHVRRWLDATVLMSSMLLAGCGEAVDPVVLKLREQFLSERPMGDERPIPEIRKALNSGEIKSDSPFTVRVRINAGELHPFVSGEARFLVTDATGHDGDESHNPHECPFCRRDIKSMMAMVEFTDSDGRVISIDARELFGVGEFQLLVLEGTGHVDEEDILVISARRMSVQR